MKLKNLNHHSSIPAICIILVFIGFSVGILTATYWGVENFTFRNILEATINNAMGVGAALAFGSIGIFLFRYIFKKPIIVKANLISKKIAKKEKYEERLCFNIYNEEKNSPLPNRQYFVSHEPTDLEEGMDYALYVKELTWNIKKVEKINGTMEFTTKTPPIRMDIVFYMIGFIFLFPLVCFIISLFL